MVLPHPFRMIIAGPSECGKTTFVCKLLEERSSMIDPPVSQVLWYSGNPKSAEKAKSSLSSKALEGVSFEEGIPDVNELTQHQEGEEEQSQLPNRLIILDDFMGNAEVEDKAFKLFTQESHHNNISVIYILQNYFYQSKGRVNIGRSASHVVMFNTPQDATPVTKLLHNMQGNLGSERKRGRKGPSFVSKVVSHLADSGHGYLMMVLTQKAPQSTRIRTDIYTGEDNVFYVAQGATLAPQLTKTVNTECRTEEI